MCLVVVKLYGNRPNKLFIKMNKNILADKIRISLWWVIFHNSSLIFFSIIFFNIFIRDFFIQKFIGINIIGEIKKIQFICMMFVVGSNDENKLVIIFNLLI